MLWSMDWRCFMQDYPSFVANHLGSGHYYCWKFDSVFILGISIKMFGWYVSSADMKISWTSSVVLWIFFWIPILQKFCMGYHLSVMGWETGCRNLFFGLVAWGRFSQWDRGTLCKHIYCIAASPLFHFIFTKENGTLIECKDQQLQWTKMSF